MATTNHQLLVKGLYLLLLILVAFALILEVMHLVLYVALSAYDMSAVNLLRVALLLLKLVPELDASSASLSLLLPWLYSMRVEYTRNLSF